MYAIFSNDDHYVYSTALKSHSFHFSTIGINRHLNSIDPDEMAHKKSGCHAIVTVMRQYKLWFYIGLYGLLYINGSSLEKIVLSKKANNILVQTLSALHHRDKGAHINCISKISMSILLRS